MIKRFLTCVILFTGISAHADILMFLGGGLGFGQLQLEQASNESNFHSFAYFIQGGMFFEFSNTFALMAAADYGIGHAYNNVNSEKYLEDAKTAYTSMKTGVSLSNITFGAGLRNVDMDVKSVSTTSGAINTKYKGQLPMYFLNYGFRMKDGGFRTIIEIQNITGKINDLLYNDTNVSLNLVMTLGH